MPTFSPIFTEDVTGLTTVLDGVAASTVAGPNAWQNPFASPYVRVTGGGIKPQTPASGTHHARLNCVVAQKKVVATVVNPAAWWNSGTPDGTGPAAVILMNMADPDQFASGNKYHAFSPMYSDLRRVGFQRGGAGAGSNVLDLDVSSLSLAGPSWNFIAEETDTAGTWTITVTDGTTSVGGVGAGTWVDDGTGGSPAGPWFGISGKGNIPIKLAVSQISAAQLAAPTSDITTGWTPSAGASIFGVVDEAVVNDADYAFTTSNATAEVKFAAVTDPISSTGHKVRYRISVAAGATLTVGLYQGTTLIKSWTHTGAVALQTFEQTLSGAEADSITNYADLRLRVVTS